MFLIPMLLLALLCLTGPLRGQGLERLDYNHPGLIVDLGVGLWASPLPMDYDGDGDLDLVVVCPGTPYEGTYFFENPGAPGDGGMPVFDAPVRISRARRNAQISYVEGRPHILTPGLEYPQFVGAGLDGGVELPLSATIHGATGRVRANQWKYADYDGDDRLDLIVGVGDWTDYGWDNAFNSKGKWTQGPLHGFVYVVRNIGPKGEPQYSQPVRVRAGDAPLDVFGMPSPNLADFDGDGDLDLLCGEFLDQFTYFENLGTRTSPRFAPGRRLRYRGQALRMDLQMITPVAIDWTGDGHVDLVVGQEDGRVALLEHSGQIVDGSPQFLPPRFFRQQAADLKFGALATPASFDWDGDDDQDLIVGNTAGYIGFIENLDGGDPPRWAAPRYLEADGEVIHIQAGYNGSIQGPAEAKWGYTTLSVADWDHDGLPDVIANSIWGKVVWYRNMGTRSEPRLASALPVEVQWSEKLTSPPRPVWNWWGPEGEQLATQWRTTPVVVDLDQDGLNDLVMLDHEGYLAFFKRAKVDGRLKLSTPRRVFRAQGRSVFDSRHQAQEDVGSGWLRLNSGRAGGSGRRKLCFADWDGDGRLDLLVNSRPNVNFLRNLGVVDGVYTFGDMGPVSDRVLAGHTTSPAVVDWNRDRVPDLLVGAEDGHFYYLKNPF